MARTVEGLTPAQLGAALNLLATIEVIGAAMRERAIRLAHNGVDIPGWEPAMTPARRGWKDEDSAAAVLAVLGLTKNERYVTELLSPAQAEKALRKKGKWPKKPRGGPAPKDPLSKLLSYTETRPTIRKVL